MNQSADQLLAAARHPFRKRRGSDNFRSQATLYAASVLAGLSLSFSAARGPRSRMNIPYVGVLSPVLIGGVLAGLVAFSLGALCLWWWLPKWQVNHLKLTIYDRKLWADVEDNFRKTIGQLLVGVLVLVGAGIGLVGAGLGAAVAYRQLLSQQKASHDLLIS